MKHLILRNAKVTKSFYDYKKEAASIQIDFTEAPNHDTILDFISAAYAGTPDKFKPDLLTSKNPEHKINLHTKYDIKHYRPAESEPERLSVKDFGALIEGQKIDIKISYNGDNPNGVYPTAIQAETLKIKNAYNPFA